MSSRKKIPSYDFYKTLSSPLCIEFHRLEKSYNTYDASNIHRHNYFEILFFEKSGGSHEIDFISFPIVKNSIHFISPEQVHRLRRDKKVTGFVLSFLIDFFINDLVNSKFIESLPFFIRADVIPVVQLKQKSEAEYIQKIFQQIDSEIKTEMPDTMEMLALHVANLLLSAKRIHEREHSSGKKSLTRSPLTEKYRQLVSAHFLKQKSISYYASMLNVSPGHLNDVIQKETGNNCSEILYARIILEAKRLLFHSSMSIKEIALALGYADPSHFSRFFRNQTGNSPEEFRLDSRELSH